MASVLRFGKRFVNHRAFMLAKMPLRRCTINNMNSPLVKNASASFNVSFNKEITVGTKLVGPFTGNLNISKVSAGIQCESSVGRHQRESSVMVGCVANGSADISVGNIKVSQADWSLCAGAVQKINVRSDNGLSYSITEITVQKALIIQLCVESFTICGQLVEINSTIGGMVWSDTFSQKTTRGLFIKEIKNTHIVQILGVTVSQNESTIIALSQNVECALLVGGAQILVDAATSGKIDIAKASRNASRAMSVSIIHAAVSNLSNSGIATGPLTTAAVNVAENLQELKSNDPNVRLAAQTKVVQNTLLSGILRVMAGLIFGFYW